MITAEHPPFPGIRVARAKTTAESAALTGGVAGRACGLIASLMGLMIPMQGPMGAMSPILMTLTGAVFGAMVGAFISLVAEAALASYRTDADADRIEASLFERVAATVRASDSA